MTESKQGEQTALHPTLKEVLREALKRGMSVRDEVMGEVASFDTVKIIMQRNSPAGLQYLGEISRAVHSTGTLGSNEELHYFRADVLDQEHNLTGLEFISYYVQKIDDAA